MYIVQDGENSKVGKKLTTCSEFAYICTIVWQIFKFKVQIPYTKNEIRVEKLNAHTYQSSPFCLILQNIIYNINGAGGWNTWRKEFVITVMIRVQFFYISCSYTTKKVKNLEK